MVRLARLMFGVCLGLSLAASGIAADSPPAKPSLAIGIDRSNMGTEWTLAPPAEPDIAPFNGPYNGAGVFEARRRAVLDGIARLHAQWFRDGFGPETPTDVQNFVDIVAQVHARNMQILAVVGPTGSDFAPQDLIDKAASGCQWGTYPLSRIDLGLLRHRLRAHFDAVKKAGLAVDAFEIGNELDLYCNDADMPKTAEFARHNWKWFLTTEQVRRFAAGYAPFLKTFAAVIKAYFPTAKIITFGMSNPTGNSAALIQALANFPDASGKAFDYTSLVDGYGSHIYLAGSTTLDMLTRVTTDLTSQAAMLPHNRQKPIWITEWNEAAAAFWSSKTWYFQSAVRGGAAVDLNMADPRGIYPAMTRAEVIHAFYSKVLEPLRSAADPVNLGYVFYYSYDSVGKSAMCDDTAFNRSRGIKGICFSGVLDPKTGNLLPDVAAAIINRQ